MRAQHFQQIQQKLFLSSVHRLSLSSLVRPGLALVIVCGLVAGCSTGNQGTVSTVSGVTMQGRVRGGQQPVTGAQVYLFAAGATGYGSTPTSLLTGSGVTTDGNGNGYVTSDSSGNFSVTGDYTCPSASSEIHVMARGGNPGLPGNVNNSSLALMAAAGTCGSLTSSTFLQVDEQTTTAAAFMLAPFATVATGATGSARESFATSSTNAAGLANGVQTIQYVLGQGAGAGFEHGGGHTFSVRELKWKHGGVLGFVCIGDSGGWDGPSGHTGGGADPGAESWAQYGELVCVDSGAGAVSADVHDRSEQLAASERRQCGPRKHVSRWHDSADWWFDIPAELCAGFDGTDMDLGLSARARDFSTRA